ncbi:MAG: beta-glucosidase family protein [Chitinivibrionales bacterium]
MHSNEKGRTLKPLVDSTALLSYEDATAVAREHVQSMSLDEKIEHIGGKKFFYVKGFDTLQIPDILLADATQGVHLLEHIDLKKSTAFPAPICLASTWNPQLCEQYAYSVGEECRAGGIGVLLGPGMNIYRISQNGRNFEYFGEDPFLAARMIEQYVGGVQKTGTIATLKHFLCNNTDHRRRTSNSIVDERTLHEIYLPAFKAGIKAGALAVMTSYNQLNGEWAGQSKWVIQDLLKHRLGFRGLVMTDWWSIWDPHKALESGLDLDMPGHGRRSPDDFDDFGNPFLRDNAKKLVEDGSVSEELIDTMVTTILRVFLMMGFHARQIKDSACLERYRAHEETALQTAREGIVLLKNEDNILPIHEVDSPNTLLCGPFADDISCGGGAAKVEGYDHWTLRGALEELAPGACTCRENPTDDEIRKADCVLACIGTLDSEGWDSPFDLDKKTADFLDRITTLSTRVIVIMNAGRGVKLTPWIDTIAGLLYLWYPGQIGNYALAEILLGHVNPSGKLPVTIEKDFRDSPGYPYLPKGDRLYTGWEEDFNMDFPVYDINYDEGVMVGYRWYDHKQIEPLFPFGFGLSYTRFTYSDLSTNTTHVGKNQAVKVSFSVQNTGDGAGKETAQLYISAPNDKISRPPKELKGFKKLCLKPGETKRAEIVITACDFACWDSQTHDWFVEEGEYQISIGSSSRELLLKTIITVDSSFHLKER